MIDPTTHALRLALRAIRTARTLLERAIAYGGRDCRYLKAALAKEARALAGIARGL